MLSNCMASCDFRHSYIGDKNNGAYGCIPNRRFICKCIFGKFHMYCICIVNMIDGIEGDSIPCSAKVWQWQTWWMASNLSKFSLLNFSILIFPMIATSNQFVKDLLIKISCRPYSSEFYPFKLLHYMVLKRPHP